MGPRARQTPPTLDVPCTIEIEESRTSLHAHVDLDGVEVEPGDSVQIHDAPSQVAFGERLVCRRRATVTRASRPRRVWTRLAALLELAELFEVGFSARRTP